MIILILGVVILLLVVTAAILRLKIFKGNAEGFWKGIGVPLTTPVLVAALGIVFSLLSEAHYDNQKKVELLREVLASKDRPDIAFLTAVGDHLVTHLKRRDSILAELRRNLDADKRTELQSSQQFEERAAYFFYGMFHAALIDFYASKGYQLYPRLWMEEAFDKLTDRVETLANGNPDDFHLDMMGVEESALYKYFGAAAATFKNITDRSGEPTKSAVLFDFNLMLDGVVKRPDLPQDEYQKSLENALRKGCKSFQARLNGQGPDALHVGDLELTIAAITALDDYAFNKLFGVWYQGPDSPDEVKSLTEEIPERISLTPPKEYIFYPLRGWEEQDIRKITWKIIFDSVSPKFRRG